MKATARTLSQLLYRPEISDVWDRPACDWGDGPASEDERERWKNANSCYRLGSRALAADELDSATCWLATAGTCEHPGALFRLAVVVLRVLAAGVQSDVRFCVGAAAGAGHGDALRMRPLLSGRATRLEPFENWEDPLFGPEILRALNSWPPPQASRTRI
ncbi:hypothetical protein ACFWB1_33880 [Streptomyces goshikiensis]|uniref:hypothetical protein n=1 Tax=Streptomyces goshikiensis TaxID=1942 RepID=UPI00368DF422